MRGSPEDFVNVLAVLPEEIDRPVKCVTVEEIVDALSLVAHRGLRTACSIRIARIRYIVQGARAGRGPTSSAAAEGVGARRSATKSAIVKSVSWPTALTTGIRERAIARATSSSLNGQRSSSDPPRGQDDDVDPAEPAEVVERRPRFPIAAPAPCTAHRVEDELNAREPPARRRSSCPEGPHRWREVTMPILRGNAGSFLFARRIEKVLPPPASLSASQRQPGVPPRRAA